LKILSLFCGAGGLDLGFEQLGFEPIVAYDVHPSAVITYNHNRGKTIARQADLSQLTGDEIINDIEKLSPGTSPCGIVGGPPCQYFSHGNRALRDQEDPRRQLPIQYARILKQLNERYDIDFFIFENVYGLAQPAHQEDLDNIITLFRNSGFHISSKIYNAYNFGVPQIRKRLFIIGWNTKHYRENEYQSPEGTINGLSVRDTISDLPEPLFYRRNVHPSEIPYHPNHWTMQPKSKKFNTPAPEGLRRTPRSFRRLNWDLPSDTVAYGHNEIHIHPKGSRRLSIYEAMLLQGFPPQGYELLGPLTHQVRLVSDAVPPPLANALALSIKNFLRNNNQHERAR
jgi:DNA (cytosine-5)-methyltransferase 1